MTGQTVAVVVVNLDLYTKSYNFYMAFLGIVYNIKLKYSKELLDHKVKNTKTYLSNRPHLLWVYRRDNPRGMLGTINLRF